MSDIVLDTNILVGALQKGDGVNRRIMELCFLDEYHPVMGEALYLEYQDLIARDDLFENSMLARQEREDFLDDYCSICRWVDIHYRWRPNLKDEADNHIIELAMAAGVKKVISWNKKDFKNSDLLTPHLEILTPVELIRKKRLQN